MIKVGSFNIRYDHPEENKEDAWHLRKNDLIQSIAQEDFDLCGLQEVLPHVQEDFEKLEHFYFYGVCRDDGKTQGEMNPILVNPKTLEVLDEGTFWLSDTPDVPSHYETSACRRIASWVKVKHQTSQKIFTFVNTHLDHESLRARQQQIHIIKKFLKDKAFILSGDFNTTKHENVLDKLDEIAFDVAKKNHAVQGTFNDFDIDLNLEAMARIDYIFVSKDMTATSFKTHINKTKSGRYVSDHFMISAKITL